MRKPAGPLRADRRVLASWPFSGTAVSRSLEQLPNYLYSSPLLSLAGARNGWNGIPAGPFINGDPGGRLVKKKISPLVHTHSVHRQ